MKATVLLIILLIFGCGDFSMERDNALEAKISEITTNSKVEVMKMMTLTVAITVFGDEAFKLNDQDRDALANKIGNVALKNSNSTETVMLIFLKDGNGTMTASYTWENVNGQLKPLKPSS